jgi:CubicO group peptidase (beta-lactamase class C family)
VAALLLAAACTGSGGSRPSGSVTTEGEGVVAALLARLQGALDDSLGDSDAPGAQAAVVFADGSVWSGGSGLADVDAGRPVTPHTLFAIASITKTFTAALVMRLVEDGDLSLDDRLTRWLPDFPHARGVTVRQLLGSTSGLAALAPSDIAQILRRDPGHRFTDDEVYLVVTGTGRHAHREPSRRTSRYCERASPQADTPSGVSGAHSPLDGRIQAWRYQTFRVRWPLRSRLL